MSIVACGGGGQTEKRKMKKKEDGAFERELHDGHVATVAATDRMSRRKHQHPDRMIFLFCFVCLIVCLFFFFVFFLHDTNAR